MRLPGLDCAAIDDEIDAGQFLHEADGPQDQAGLQASRISMQKKAGYPRYPAFRTTVRRAYLDSVVAAWAATGAIGA